MKLSELEINKILIDKEIILSSKILRKYLKSVNFFTTFIKRHSKYTLLKE